ncbi:MAG: hypothetical protein KY433_06625, partial [Actinobacteria bacterium]|nr:hypothetical protein [Actinomycetota bacterium]
MAERGAQPQVPAIQRRALRALRGLFTPLMPDDYLDAVSVQERAARWRTAFGRTDSAAAYLVAEDDGGAIVWFIGVGPASAPSGADDGEVYVL